MKPFVSPEEAFDKYPQHQQGMKTSLKMSQIWGSGVKKTRAHRPTVACSSFLLELHASLATTSITRLNLRPNCCLEEECYGSVKINWWSTL